MSGNITCDDDFDNPDTCPLGCICDGEGSRHKCSEIQERWESSFGIGVIHDGAWCPSNNNKIQNCPVGNYCPDPATKIPCPKGKFCPYKTKVPEIKCVRCPEGAETFWRDRYGYIIFIIFWSAVVLFLLVRKIRQWQLAKKEKQQQLLDFTLNAKKEAQLVKKQRQQIERLSPKLKLIYQRVGLEWTDSDNHVVDTKKLVDAIDTDNNNIVSYAELNVALKLEEDQLREFIKIMNKRAGHPLDTPHVGVDVFVDHFLDTMEQAANYDPSPEDAAKIFEDVARRQKGDANANTITLNGLFDTELMFFLSYPQINRIIKDLKTMAALDAEDGTSYEDDYNTTTNAKTTHMVTTRFGKVEKVTMTKEVFMEQYPFVLHYATLGESKQLPRGVDITFQNLSLDVTVGGQTTAVLDNVTGRLKRKTMTALMGGSGTGKTSLLNALCGRAFYGEVSGQVLINGHETTIDEHLDVVGFVPQDDIVYAELTVRENFIFAGKFRLPKGTNLEQIEDLAEEVMANLGLTRVADNIVGDVTNRGVSGGEKKRVNIGIELMANPSILFLDEPTSGLDSNSAMMVMKGLRSLVLKKGVTVCSVIHQPRKNIFELFDSMMLLGVGGRVVYHGRVNKAEKYFKNLGFTLPPGESVADWLIDISSGRLAPSTIEERSGGESLRSTTICSSPEEEQAVELVPGEEENESYKAKLNCLKLYRHWIKYFDSLNGEAKKIYEAPDPFDLPIRKSKQPFSQQLWCHMNRNFLVQKRNIASKAMDTIIITAAVTAICLLDGVLELTIHRRPNIRNEYEVLTTTDSDFLLANQNQKAHIFESFFAYSLTSYETMVFFGTKLGVIIAPLLSLAAAKVLIEKRLELNREAGSGYNLNAYYLAVNITSTIEHSIQILFIALATHWLRYSAASSPSGDFCWFLNFVMLSWLCTSWSLFFPLVVPPKNIVIVLSFFIVFFGLLFNGSMAPAKFKEIYESPMIAFISGMFSTTRYFLETMVVSEVRVLPPQSGFTLQPVFKYGVDLSSEDINGLDFLGLAQHDMPEARNQSNSGWYYQMLPAFLVGLTVRFGGALMLHICNRSQQARPSIIKELKRSVSCRIETFVLFCLWFLFFMLSLWKIGLI